MLVAWQFNAFAQPTNDNPCNATPLPVTAAGTCNYSVFSSIGATNSPVPDPGCAFYFGKDVWFSVTVPPSGSVVIDAIQGSINDGGMAVYSGTCNNLLLLDCDDDASANGFMPMLFLTGLTPGSTIYIRFWEFGGGTGSFGLCATTAPPPTNQDCLNAIPICKNIYNNPISYSGTGNVHNEINPANSCLGLGERNDVWYTFTVQSSGNLNFLITPVDTANDYDWAVYNLTNANCTDIYNNPGLQVSCNYSDTHDSTGPNGGSVLNSQGALGTPFNATIPVIAGQTYAINVSNFSNTTSGFTINFSNSTATIFDNVAPQLNVINQIPGCSSNSINFNFSENILCSTVQNGNFTLSGPGGPYTIASSSSIACSSGAAYYNYLTEL